MNIEEQMNDAVRLGIKNHMEMAKVLKDIVSLFEYNPTRTARLSRSVLERAQTAITDYRQCQEWKRKTIQREIEQPSPSREEVEKLQAEHS